MYRPHLPPIMRPIFTIPVVITVLSLTACGVFAPKKGDTAAPPVPIDKIFQYSEKASPNNQTIALHKDFLAGTQYCRSFMNFYERRATYSNNSKLGISIIGTIAGSLLGPLGAAAGWGTVATATFSGASGLSNAAQASVDQSGLSSNHFLTTRMLAYQKIDEAMKKFEESTTDEQRRIAIVALYQCSTPEVSLGSESKEGDK